MSNMWKRSLESRLPDARRLVGVGSVALSLACGGLTGLTGCTGHDESDPPAIVEPELGLVAEVEPSPVLPAIVAPALPELAPTRPLAHLELLWENGGEDSGAKSAWALGTSVVVASQADAEGLGLVGPAVDLSSLAASWEVPQDELWPVAVAGPLMLFNERQREFSVVERNTGVLSWQTEPKGGVRRYGHFITPRLLVTLDYGPDSDRLTAWALEDGREVWQVGGEGPNSDIAGSIRFRAMWTDGERGWVSSRKQLTAFSLATGKKLWAVPLEDHECGMAVGDGVVVVEDSAGHRLYDAELGEELGRLPDSPARSCGWGGYGVASGVIDSGRLYAIDSGTMGEGEGEFGQLRSYDLATRRELWAVKRGLTPDVLVVDHGAVYMVGNPYQLRALDADTGETRAEIEIGSSFELRVEPVGGAAGPYLVVEGAYARQMVIGRTEQKNEPERYELHGRLVPSEGMRAKQMRGVSVRVGGRSVETDKRGRFVHRGTARGVLVVEVDQEVDIDQDAEVAHMIIFEPLRVRLDGRGRYELEDIEAWEQSIE